MEKLAVTINNIEFDLYDKPLDTEYRESLANALMKLGYINDYPINLSMGTKEHQEELERVYNTPLKSKQLKEIIKFMSKEMKDDFQYEIFKPIELYYLRLADELKKKEERRFR